jgi:hypothetical protein
MRSGVLRLRRNHTYADSGPTARDAYCKRKVTQDAFLFFSWKGINMNPKKLLTISAFAGALTLSTAALAATNFSVELNVGPPAPIYEAVPAPRPGYVWARGY